jgi:hypothetical protein
MSQPRKARPTDGAVSRASCVHLSSSAPRPVGSQPNGGNAFFAGRPILTLVVAGQSHDTDKISR